MGNFTLMPVHSYRLKIYGIIISVIAIALMIVLKLNDTFSLSTAITRDAQFNYLLLINCFGLFLIAYSKERYEDERTQILRDKTFRLSFVFLLAILLSNSFTAMAFNLDPSVYNISSIVPFDVTIALSFQLIVFYIRINTNASVSGPELTVMQNILLHKALSIILIIAMIITSIVLLLI